jgi:hypothetical protein
MALARLQSGDKAQFSEVVNSLELAGEGTTVSLRFAVPGNVIDALSALSAQRRQQPPAAQPAPLPSPSPAVPSL